MLVFIIPVIHHKKCISYEHVSDTLNKTLYSICQQIDPSFRVIIVCNKKPDIKIANDKIEIIEVDFPVPPLPTGLNDRHSHVFRDKGTKVVVGLVHARKYNPTHIMVSDHDDFVSNKLSQYVKNNPNHPGWFFKEGYVYSGITKIISKRDNFQSYCGTSHIIRTDLLDVKSIDQTGLSYQQIQDNVDQYFLQSILGNHVYYLTYFKNKNIEIEPLPFIGAIWHLDNGNNSSQLLFKNKRSGPIWGINVTSDISNEFGLLIKKRTISETILLLYFRIKNVIGKLVKHG